MDKKHAKDTGIRVEVLQGTGESVALDELVNDFLHGDVNGALHALHEPHSESKPEAPGAPKLA
ncbi:hypothetical protein G7068_06140 [Leucobacter viscericola]|uniref:Uncharacterized protein n=1 Tax=Leucobacter viscericola TaxID=2714935 RepID=A0A6G7XE32_9MICO|nr:hypothetical protein [Leucobacter viscericola]QIK62825.1 hypothetical protein G7068_06140 [Leucobacter viscericola]